MTDFRIVFLLLATLPALGLAAPRRLVVASGDCKDAELGSQANAFLNALVSSPEQDVLSASGFSERLFPQPTKSYEDLQRQLDSAQDHFYESRNGKAAVAIDEALQQINRLPVGDARWKLYVNAQLLHGLNYRAMGKQKESDTAFRSVLRLQPTYELDPDYFAPSVRQGFDKLRRELNLARKVKLSVKSTLPTSDVYLDGLKMGQTPLTLDVLAGTYDLNLVKGEAISFPRQIQAQGADTPLLVDLAYEGSVSATPFPCLAAPEGSDERILSHAIRLGGTLGVEEVIVVRLERPSSGPKWFAATVLNVEGGQKLREGGFKTQGLDAPAEALSALVDFVTTGRSPSNLVVMNANGRAPWEQAVTSDKSGAPHGGMDISAPDLLSDGIADSADRPTPALRVASYVLLGTGMAALGGAGVVRFLAQKNVDDLEKRLENGRILSTDREALRLRNSLVQKSNVLTGLLAGGGAAVAAGAVLFLLSPSPQAPPPVSVGVATNGEEVSASLSGTF
ncbi:PEGA domain-containing protein [Myxococcus llanfairpwllgwyngyllgogerychwyrndrobwllllantysiliogogogochensis]|uniref:PEGA domain-containing protein n=1 Tax=Myxococcus llanfairpwllgwyngyllgogerychwyrndrobwllllantysiliogogogochensis TaxID=2590453 RepID=A0A540WKL3_9BACT|nr:PEGA domain-containing protein [Myxococcus llanfairpwllgwyngyllgogerychwyrndrobwllllantysiliogogogochensis]TQF09570.1 PEGA domain-containing protein [Myxococcus llanfairpwllgwyngyllgogerychwyrndrobwllllantysiliogogogochensis]